MFPDTAKAKIDKAIKISYTYIFCFSRGNSVLSFANSYRIIYFKLLFRKVKKFIQHYDPKCPNSARPFPGNPDGSLLRGYADLHPDTAAI
jgi:hypothetical protein